MMAGLSDSQSEDQMASEKTEAAPQTLHRDELFHLLQNSRRRATLRYLFEHDDDQPVVMRDVAEAVAAWENDTTLQQLTSAERQRVYIALYQSHLLKLDDHGIIDYDQDRGTIELRELAYALRPYLGDGLDDANAELVQSASSSPGESRLITKLSGLFD